MTGKHIYFVRHGETDWNVELRFQGQQDVPVNVKGQIQADANGKRLAALAADAGPLDFVSSPLGRTRETMERIRVAMGLPRDGYRTDARLMEVHYGDWEGSTLAEISARFPELAKRRTADKWNFMPPGDKAESYAVLAERVRNWLDSVSHPLVCVTHGGVVRSMFHLVGGVGADDASEIIVPQDRILEYRNGELIWR